MTDNLNMLPYNTGYSTMTLPEYGRNIQNLIDYCVTLEDREERTRCAHAIVRVMKTITPADEDENVRTKKIWDHLNIMSGFQLDIDFPCEVIRKENVNPHPERLPYSSSSIKGRHYGRNIEMMIATVADMDEGPEKDQLIGMIANHMKKLMLVHNKEGVSDAKILKDLSFYSNGKINLDPETYLLHEFKQQTNIISKGGKNNRKRKMK